MTREEIDFIHNLLFPVFAGEPASDFRTQVKLIVAVVEVWEKLQQMPRCPQCGTPLEASNDTWGCCDRCFNNAMGG